MYWNNRTASLLYKIVFLILCGWGLYLNTGLANGNFNLDVFVYYTILSNLLCFFYFIATLTTPLIRLKGAVVFTITVTMLIYHFLLVPAQFNMGNHEGIFSIGNLLVHYIIPILVIIDWIVFSPKGAFKTYDPLLWITIPLTYFIFILIRARLIGNIPGTNTRFPYPFINLDELGWAQLGSNLAGIAIFFLLLGYAIWGIDRLAFRLKRG